LRRQNAGFRLVVVNLSGLLLNALEICTPQSLPIDCVTSARSLGNLLFVQGNWLETINAYFQAIVAVEQIRAWAYTEQRKQEILEQANDIYVNLVQACLNAQQYDKALEYAERSKSRNLVDLIANRDTYPRGEIAPEILTGLIELRKQLLIANRETQQQNNRFDRQLMDSDNSQRGITISQSEYPIADRDRLVFLKQELDQLITTHIQPVDPSFQLTQKVEPISFEEMRSALPNDRTALVTWYVAQTKLLTFIVTLQATHPQLIESTPEAFQQFMEVLTDYQTAYSQYRERLNNDWKDGLPKFLEQFSQTLGLAETIQQLPAGCDQLILIPHRFLHLIPLHALPIILPDNTQTCLLDRFPQGVRYAPSVQLLKLAQQWNRPPLQNLLAVQDPTKDLLFTNLEVTALRTHFQPCDRVFRHQEAQKSALTAELLAQSNCVHFSCHGVFDFANPTQSALMLSESLVTTPDGEKIRDLEKCLTLGEIFTQDLRQCRLVTLSACETGLIDVSKQIDEYIGLPSGFLFAGSPSIVSTLWAVDDLSTTCLMIRFYDNLQQTDSVSIALNQAQQWLRRADGQEIKEMIEPWLAQSGIPAARLYDIQILLDSIEQKSKPFAAPYHWAAFCAIGQ
jgi:CHAT domain-containing protein